MRQWLRSSLKCERALFFINNTFLKSFFYRKQKCAIGKKRLKAESNTHSKKIPYLDIQKDTLRIPVKSIIKPQ